MLAFYFLGGRWGGFYFLRFFRIRVFFEFFIRFLVFVLYGGCVLEVGVL